MHERDSREVERRVEAVILSLPDDPESRDQIISIVKGRKEWKAQCIEAIEYEYNLARKNQKASRELRENRFRVENYLYWVAFNEWVLTAPEYPSIEKSLDRIHHWTHQFESLNSAFAGLRVSIGSRLQAMLASIATTIEDGRKRGGESQSANPSMVEAIRGDESPVERVNDVVAGSPSTQNKRFRNKRKIHSPEAAARINRFLKPGKYPSKILAERFGITSRTIRDSRNEERFSRELLEKFACLMGTTFDALTEIPAAGDPA